MGNKVAIKHIEFWVSNLRRSMKFYEGIFRIIGWEKIESNAFSNDETKIYFVQQLEKSERTVGPRHLCFLATSRKIVNEIGVFISEIKANLIQGPLESQYRNRSSYTIDFKDPDGYVIEVATASESLRRKKV